MAGCIFQQMEGMVPYEGKVKFKDPASEIKVTVEVIKPKPGGLLSLFKNHFKKKNTNAQTQDYLSGGGPLYDPGSYRNVARRSLVHRDSYRLATGGAHYNDAPEDSQQQPNITSRSNNVHDCVRAGSDRLPIQSRVPGRGNWEQHHDKPPSIPPRGRRPADHPVDTDYGNGDEELYAFAYMHQSTAQQQLNLEHQEKLDMPPPIPLSRSKTVVHQEDSESGDEEIYYDNNQLAAKEQSISNHQESSDAKKSVQTRDDNSSDEDTFGEEHMKAYDNILQARQAPSDNTIDADGYMSVFPRPSGEYMNGDFPPTSKNPPFPNHGQMWLTWKVEGREVCIPVNVAEKGKVAELCSLKVSSDL